MRVFLHPADTAPLACAGGLTISPGSVVSWEDKVTEYAIVDQMGRLRDYRGPPKKGDTTRSDFGGCRVYQGDLIALPGDNNGWYRVKDTPVTVRYFAQIWPNPVTPEDFRMNINGSLDLKVIKNLSFRVSLFVTHDAAILEGREPNDVRSTFGFSWNSN